MPNYEIIDWYYDNILDEDDLTRLDKIEKKIRANDAKGTAALWIQGSTDWSKNVGPKLAQSFQDIVNTKNEVQKTLIQDEIADATTETELKDIKIGDYEDNIINELTESINTKITELEEKRKELTEDVEVIKEIEEEIEVAKTQADIDEAIPSRTQLRKDLGTEKAQELIDKSDDKSDELFNLSQEVFIEVGGEIERAETNADLDNIFNRLDEIENLLVDDRSELRSLIRDKRL